MYGAADRVTFSGYILRVARGRLNTLPGMRRIRNTFAVLFLLGIAWVVGMRITAPYRHNREFRSKLPFFETVISDLRSSATPIPTVLTRIPIPENSQYMAHSIFAQRASGEHLAVEFVTRHGFPVKHGGFLFLSSGSFEDYPSMASRWPRRTPLGDNWFYVAD
jgi:hypothetical protein